MGNVRTTYLVDGKGRVAKRWDNVKVDGHAEAVLEAAEGMSTKPKDAVEPGTPDPVGVPLRTGWAAAHSTPPRRCAFS